MARNFKRCVRFYQRKWEIRRNATAAGGPGPFALSKPQMRVPPVPRIRGRGYHRAQLAGNWSTVKPMNPCKRRIVLKMSISGLSELGISSAWHHVEE